MRHLIFFFLLLPFLVSAQNVSIDELQKSFNEPGNAYRGKPFWSWNGDLDKDELIRQIHVMKEMGMGGFFMHSRTGLQTEYLGDEWFDLINACADEAEKLGMEAWLYDEDRWPSGLAGGLVTKYPEYRAKHMIIHTYAPKEFEEKEDYVALFSCKLKDVDCYDYKRIEKSDIKNLTNDQTVLAFCVKEKGANSFYNGYTDVDRMSREATDYFIKITHEEYKKRCGDRMSTSIKGIFTDEPNRSSALSSFGKKTKIENDKLFVPWTITFADEFKRRMGYDLIDKLPEIFYRPDGEAVSKVKWDYMEVAQQLFLENWVIPYFDWCKENNFIFTGHFLHEDNLTAQTAMQGSLMRSYEYMHYPGIDVLTENNRNYWVAKQCQSVARQMGQKFILSELYGVTGWQFDFADHKYVGDWQALYGVNLRCHHLSWYTMQGQAKRDYPASILHQSDWYTDYDFVESYFARMGYLLNQGKPVCDVLVVNPIESVWSQIRIGWSNGLSPADAEVKNLENHYRDLFKFLQGNQIDFDYGDEDIMSRHGNVASINGKAFFRVGKALYQTVVMGRMTTIRSSTLELLQKFVDLGGNVVWAGEAAPYVDAQRSNLALEFGKKINAVPFDEDALVKAIQKNTKQPVQALNQKGEVIPELFCQLKEVGDYHILMVLNSSRDKKFNNVTIKVALEGEVTEWDCESNQLFSISNKRSEKGIEFYDDFARAEEHIYTITKQKVKNSELPFNKKLVNEKPITGKFKYTLSEPNICVLDMGYVSIDGQQNNDLKEILKADESIRDHYGLPHRGGTMVQPWFKAKFADKPKEQGTVKITFPFYVEDLPEGKLQLCMETPEKFDVRINGKIIELKADGWWADKSLQLVELPKGILKKGENILEQTCRFSDDVNLEALFLMGEFAVRLDGTRKIIEKLPETLGFGCINDMGLPFYSGRVSYQVPIQSDFVKNEALLIQFPEYEGACIKIDPETNRTKMVAWWPNEADITENVKKNKSINIELALTRRNSFGPLHFTPFTGTTGPNHFISTGKSWSDNYILNRNGILKDPILKIYNKEK